MNSEQVFMRQIKGSLFGTFLVSWCPLTWAIALMPRLLKMGKDLNKVYPCFVTQNHALSIPKTFKVK